MKKSLLLAPAEGWGALGGYSVYGIGYIGYIKRCITIYYRFLALIYVGRILGGKIVRPDF